MSGNALLGSSPDDIRLELQRVLQSPSFEASQRNRSFLSHVVEEVLDGRGSRIKAYSIATQVFGRGDDFDPLQDSIVRIEAARLRRALEHFYLKEGHRPGICISIPKGTYAPAFAVIGQAASRVEIPRPPVPSLALHLLGPRILVRNIEQDCDGSQSPAIGRKLTLQVIAALTRFTDLFVYGFDTAELLDDTVTKDVQAPALSVDYTLGGIVTVSKTALVTELLLKKADGRFIWAFEDTRELGLDIDSVQFGELCADIAGHVARIIAQRDGVLDCQAREAAGEAPQHFAGYQKLLDFQDYWRSLDPKQFEPLRRDLEQTIIVDPHFAAAHACLSMVYSNAARYGYDLGQVGPPPLERAFELARRAIQLAPFSSRAYHARAIAEWFSGMTAESVTSLKTARSLNPNDPELMAELGFRLAMRMEWRAAVPLIEEAYERNPLQTGAYHMGLFFYHFAEGRFERALHEARAIGAPGIAYVHLAEAAALGELDRFDEARECLRETERIAPNLRKTLEADFAFRRIHLDLTAAITRAISRIDPGWSPYQQSPRLQSR